VTSDGTRPRSFRHGVHPDDHKQTTNTLPIERMQFVAEYVLPLSQHIGAPSKAVVEVGQRVQRGQLIAEPGGLISTALHTPVTGHIAAIELRLHPNGKMMPAVVVATDPYDSQRLTEAQPVDAARLTPEEMVERVQRGGLVGLGGAAFPSHVKFQVPEGKRVQAAVINGCECEPYLTCDDRLMVERPDAVVRGTEIILAQVGAERGYIGVEANKPDAIAALRAAVSAAIEVVPLEVKYPQGAEKLLIEADRARGHRDGTGSGPSPQSAGTAGHTRFGSRRALRRTAAQRPPGGDRRSDDGHAPEEPRRPHPEGQLGRALPHGRLADLLRGASLHPLRTLCRGVPHVPESHATRPARPRGAARRAREPPSAELLRVRCLLVRVPFADPAGPVDAHGQGHATEPKGAVVSRGPRPCCIARPNEEGSA
jgi:hypothetical protein